MSDSVFKFSPSISNIEYVNGELQFIISGDDNYGLDKSLINSLRRILLTDIPTISFKMDETGENTDIKMITNNTSLHNEMLIHRISLIPLYIDPVNYMKNYLFECKIKHDSLDEPFKFVNRFKPK